MKKQFQNEFPEAISEEAAGGEGAACRAGMQGWAWLLRRGSLLKHGATFPEQQCRTCASAAERLRQGTRTRTGAVGAPEEGKRHGARRCCAGLPASSPHLTAVPVPKPNAHHHGPAPRGALALPQRDTPASNTGTPAGPPGPNWSDMRW